MNFSDYKTWQKSVLENHAPLRLDCLNPFIAMKWSQKTGATATGHPTQMLQNVLGYGERDDIVKPIPGVRAALEDIFVDAKRNGWTLALPEDVYPFYWDAAERAGYDASTLIRFPTLPQPDFSPLSVAEDATIVVLTAPLSPLGRHLNEEEISFLSNWLEEDIERMLVLDTVYDYETPLHPSIWKLWESEQTIILNSMSKTHLQRGLFGIAMLPVGLLMAPKLRRPTPEGEQAATDALTHHPHHAVDQQRAFDAEWKRLTPAIEKMTGQTFTPPENGYMATVNISFQDALSEHNTLVVPASVFGSKKPNLSILTCLHDIGQHQA